MASQIIAGGGVVWRPGNKGAIEVLLVHRPSYHDWTFPKGKQDPGEDERMTARREVAEETNLYCRLGRRLGSVEYDTSAGNHKIVHMWAMAYSHGSFKPNSEVNKVRWLPVSKVARKLTYKRDRLFFESLDDRWWESKPHIRLVRHAEAGHRRTWTGDDRTRPLSVEGRQQALAIRERYADGGLDRILSSPYVRCVQTVEPLSAATGIEIEEHPALGEGADPKTTAALLKELTGSRSVICTHGDVITEVMGYLARRGLELDQPFNAQKGSAWKLSGPNGRLTKAKYQAPPTV